MLPLRKARSYQEKLFFKLQQSLGEKKEVAVFSATKPNIILAINGEHSKFIFLRTDFSENLTFLIDSGASISLIKKPIAQKLSNLRVEALDFNITGISGQKLENFGKNEYEI